MVDDPRELVGRWALARRVADRRARLHGTMTGELLLSADGAGLRWVESGTLTWAGARLAVTRTYLLRPGPDGWAVLFDDGRPFHPWRPGEQVTHPCGADVYTGLVTVDPGRIRTWWDVHGPAKDQRLLTRLSRSAPIGSGVPPEAVSAAPSGSRRRAG